MLLSNKLSPLQQSLNNEETMNPFHFEQFRNFPFGLKKIVTGESASITYGDSHVFKIERDIGYLAKITLKFEFTSALTTAKPFLAKRICKFIYLETVRGSRTIQAIRPEYTTSRIDNASSDVTSYYNNIMDITIPSSTYVCYNQLFMYFSEHAGLFMDLRSCEELQLRVVVADSYTEMGLDATISGLTITPIYEVFECDTVKLSKRYLAFDTYYEPAKLLTSGATSSTFEIRAKKSVYNIHMLIKSTDQNYCTINSFSLNEYVSFDRKLGYDPWSKESNLEVQNTLTYWFSMYRQRNDNTFLMNLYNLRPLTLTVNHDSIPGSNYYLYVLYEYPVLTEITETGHIERLENY